MAQKPNFQNGRARALIGVLYQHLLTLVIVLSIVLQLASIPFFLASNHTRSSG